MKGNRLLGWGVRNHGGGVIGKAKRGDSPAKLKTLGVEKEVYGSSKS